MVIARKRIRLRPHPARSRDSPRTVESRRARPHNTDRSPLRRSCAGSCAGTASRAGGFNQRSRVGQARRDDRVGGEHLSAHRTSGPDVQHPRRGCAARAQFDEGSVFTRPSYQAMRIHEFHIESCAASSPRTVRCGPDVSGAPHAPACFALRRPRGPCGNPPASSGIAEPSPARPSPSRSTTRARSSSTRHRTRR